MFWAIIKTIYDELIKKGLSEKDAKEQSHYNSSEMLLNFSKETIKELELIDCSGIETLLTDNKKVIYIPYQERELNLTHYRVRAHFRLYKEERLSYNIKDNKHKTAQHILAGLILNDTPIIVYYRDLPIQLNNLDLIKNKRTKEHIIEKSFIDKEIGVNRIADLLFKLKNPNQTFGKGIIFEIINNEDKKSIEEKSHDWAKAGYSLISIPIDNFDFENFGLKKENYLILYRLFDDIDIYLKVLNKIKDNEPLLNNFNKNVNTMERRMFLWRNGKHNFIYQQGEKCDLIYLYCYDIKIYEKNYQLECYDYTNKFINIIIWKNKDYTILDDINSYKNQLIKLEGTYFSKYRSDTQLNFNNFSKIHILKINEEKNAYQN